MRTTGARRQAVWVSFLVIDTRYAAEDQIGHAAIRAVSNVCDAPLHGLTDSTDFGLSTVGV